MYETYWGLSESPFQNRYDDRWYFESPTHEEALARLYFLVEERRRCGTLVGAAGTGKSFLLHVLASQLRRTQRKVAAIDLLGLNGSELLWQLAAAMQLSPSKSDSPVELWRSLADELAGMQTTQQQTVLLFDHLERAAGDCLRNIDRLLHLDRGPVCCLTVVVSTRTLYLPAAMGVLEDASDLRIDLAALDPQETVEYVHSSLERAGCHREVFNQQALELLHQRTHGIPRDINRMCDLSLLAGMGERLSAIDTRILQSATAELRGIDKSQETRVKSS